MTEQENGKREFAIATTVMIGEGFNMITRQLTNLMSHSASVAIGVKMASSNIMEAQIDAYGLPPDRVAVGELLMQLGESMCKGEVADEQLDGTFDEALAKEKAQPRMRWSRAQKPIDVPNDWDPPSAALVASSPVSSDEAVAGAMEVVAKMKADAPQSPTGPFGPGRKVQTGPEVP